MKCFTKSFENEFEKLYIETLKEYEEKYQLEDKKKKKSFQKK